MLLAGVTESELVKGAERAPEERQYQFTEEDKRKFLENPAYHLQFRKKTKAEISLLFGAYQQGSESSNKFREIITAVMNRRMGPGHEELKEFIIQSSSQGVGGSRQAMILWRHWCKPMSGRYSVTL